MAFGSLWFLSGPAGTMWVMEVDSHVAVTLPQSLATSVVEVAGRQLSLHEWIASVEQRLVARGMTLADLDARTVVRDG